jgi:hypothetical protein
MKTGKELKIKKFKDYSVTFGSVNNKNPKSLYINISSWAEPKHSEGINYHREIKELNKKIKQVLFNKLNSDSDSDFLKDLSIVDLDIRESGIKYGKRSFLSCELTLFMKTEIPVNSERMLYNMDELIPMIIKNIFENNKTFNFHKRKK